MDAVGLDAFRARAQALASVALGQALVDQANTSSSPTVIIANPGTAKALQLARLRWLRRAFRNVGGRLKLVPRKWFGPPFSNACRPELPEGGHCWRGGCGFFGNGRLELPFQRRPFRADHGTPHAKGMAWAAMGRT